LHAEPTDRAATAAGHRGREKRFPYRRKGWGTGDAVQPDDLTIMNTAFSAALSKLGLTDRQDPLVEIVGRRIVHAVLDGERDPIRLTEIGAGGRE
jgi:hypothetical protein